MSGGGGAHIIRGRARALAETESVQSQLGPLKLAKLQAILAKADGDWTHIETRFVIRCVLEAYEAYE